MNRREFLLTSAGAAIATSAATTRGSTGGLTAIPAIDTHTHFYDPTRPEGVPWPPSDNKLLYKPVYPADFRRVTAGLNVIGTVIVEASHWVKDNDWILKLAETNDDIVGFVGHLVPGQPEFRRELERLAANPLFRGLRFRDNYIKAIDDPAVVADLKRVADLDLSIDVLGGSSILEPTLTASRLFPELRFIIDHVPFNDWDTDPVKMRPAFAELTKQSNVFVKVSNVIRRGSDGKTIEDPEYYRNALDELFSLFGSERVIFGSNWPVSDKDGFYPILHKVVADYFASKGRETAEKYFWRNSHTAYRWLQRGPAAALPLNIPTEIK